MFDLVAQANEESKVVGCVGVDRRLAIVETPLKLPVLISAVLGPVEHASFCALREVPVLDPLSAVVGVQKVCPCDDHQDNKCLGLESDLRIIEDADRVESRLAGLGDEFRADRPNTSTSPRHGSYLSAQRAEGTGKRGLPAVPWNNGLDNCIARSL